MWKKIKKSFKRTALAISLTLLIVIVQLVIFLLIFFFSDETNLESAPYISIFVLIVISTILIIGFIFIIKKQAISKSIVINKGLNHYLENLVSNFSIGIVIFHPNGNILWASDFIEERFGKKILNENLNFFNDEIDLDKKLPNFQTYFKQDKLMYKLDFSAKDMILVIQDVTQEYSSTHYYEAEKLVIGEIDRKSTRLNSSHAQ